MRSWCTPRFVLRSSFYIYNHINSLKRSFMIFLDQIRFKKLLDIHKYVHPGPAAHPAAAVLLENATNPAATPRPGPSIAKSSASPQVVAPVGFVIRRAGNLCNAVVPPVPLAAPRSSPSADRDSAHASAQRSATSTAGVPNARVSVSADVLSSTEGGSGKGPRPRRLVRYRLQRPSLCRLLPMSSARYLIRRMWRAFRFRNNPRRSLEKPLLAPVVSTNENSEVQEVAMKPTRP